MPKNEEAKLLTAVTEEHSQMILPNSVEMPPLMKEFIVKDYEKKGLEVCMGLT